MNANGLLDARDIEGGYGRVQLLWKVNISVRPGQTVGLLGPNGSGKSTLMRTLVGLNEVWSGAVSFKGEDVTTLLCHERVARGLGMVPAGRRLFLGLSVEDNLKMGAYLFKNSSDVEEGLELAYGFFPVLKRYRRQIVGRLSGGEQQMCAIARGLMSRPNLLLIDELSLGLAPKVIHELTDTLMSIRQESGIALVIVEQDVRTAMALCDYVYILSEGRVALEGSPDQLAGTPQLKEVFLGMA